MKVSVELEGKQTPCPECRRITKVPLRVKDKPKDWRQVDSRAVAAGRRDSDPEGAWGTNTSASNVSKMSLELAGVEVEDEEPPSVLKRLQPAAIIAVGIFLFGGGIWWFVSSREHSQRDTAATKALTFLQRKEDTAPLAPESAAAIHCGLAEYCRRSKPLPTALESPYAPPTNAKEITRRVRTSPEAAQDEYRSARGLIQDAASASERDAFLLEVALGQAELGGDKQQVKDFTRLPWATVVTELARTLAAQRSPDARAETLRRLCRQLIDKPAVDVAALAQQLPAEHKAEALAVIGLERWRAQQLPEAKTAAAAAQRLVDRAVEEAKNDKEQQKPPPVPPPSLVALYLLLGQNDQVEALKKLVTDDPRTVFAVNQGTVESQARQTATDADRRKNELADLRKWIKTLADPLDQLRLLGVLAAVGLEPETKNTDDLDTVVQLVEGPLKGQLEERPSGKPDVSWLLLRLVRAAVQAGLDDPAKKLAGAIPDTALRGRAQLELLRGKLERSSARAEDSAADEVDAKSPAHNLARGVIARHNARHGNLSIKAVDAWQPEALKPFGYVGIALGLQDKEAK